MIENPQSFITKDLSTSDETSSLENNVSSSPDDLSKNFIIFMTLIGSTFGVSTMGLSSICAKTGILLYVILLTLATVVNFCSYYSFIYLTNHYKL